MIVIEQNHGVVVVDSSWSSTTINYLRLVKQPSFGSSKPRCSMYGIFTYIWVIFRVNVGKYSIHGAYGKVPSTLPIPSARPWNSFRCAGGSSGSKICRRDSIPGVPSNGCFTMENAMKMDDLEVPLFQENKKKKKNIYIWCIYGWKRILGRWQSENPLIGSWGTAYFQTDPDGFEMFPTSDSIHLDLPMFTQSNESLHTYHTSRSLLKWFQSKFRFQIVSFKIGSHSSALFFFMT